MKVFLLLFLLFLTACSGGDGSPNVSSSGLSANQVKAKALIEQDLNHLRGNQYGISDSDLDILRDEGLITNSEMNSLTIVK